MAMDIGMSGQLDHFLFGLYHIMLNLFVVLNSSFFHQIYLPCVSPKELQSLRFPLTFLAYSFESPLLAFVSSLNICFSLSLFFISYSCRCFPHNCIIFIQCLVTSTAFRGNKLRNILFANNFDHVQTLLPLNCTIALISLLAFLPPVSPFL